MIIRNNFFTFALNICCDSSSEPSRDSSDEGSQHMVSMKIKKNHTSSNQIPPLI